MDELVEQVMALVDNVKAFDDDGFPIEVESITSTEAAAIIALVRSHDD